MDEESYKRTLNDYDFQISEMEQTIQNLHKEIAEVEEAKENVKDMRRDFDSFVERKKQKNSKQTKGKYVKAFSSFIAKATSFLSGAEYNQANEKIEEINRLISLKSNSLYNDLAYCECELARLRGQRDTTCSEYTNFLKSLEEGGGVN